MFTNKSSGWHALRIAFGLIVMVLFINGTEAVNQISSCNPDPISSPGEYILANDITVGNLAVTTCIAIASNNIVFDGENHFITGNFALEGTYGIYVNNATNIITNVTIKNLSVKNWSYGIDYKNTRNGKIINNNVSFNKNGILLSNGSNNNLIENNTIYLNNNHGIYIDSSQSNIIYNNYFNNSNNFFFNNTNINYWNITKTAGTNIIGGSYLGGNFWAYPNGTGHSQTCIDGNRDGICDSAYTLDSNNIDYLPLAIWDIIPPASITNLRNRTYAPTYINWTWTDPQDSDFAKVMIYINGVFKRNVTKGTRYYNATNLIPNTSYKISTHTIDTSGNINKTWVNHTAKTARDYTPPASITNLTNRTYARTYINWTWKDPSTYDFTKVMVYINGIFKTNITKGRQYYNATGLKNNTSYKISTHTVDTSGNINMTWVNHTAKTAK